MQSDAPSRPIRIWALLGRRAGDNDQVLALAQALGLPFEVKSLRYNRLRSLGPRLLGQSFVSLTSTCRADILSEPAPDLSISAGHRSVPVVAALRARSGGRMHSIHIGFPRVSPSRFDLVITTPQYPVPDHPAVLRIPYAFTTNAVAGQRSGDDVRDRKLARPCRLLIVGGPTLFWKLDVPVLLRTLAAMLNDAGDGGRSVVVATSPRTPPSLRKKIEAIVAKLQARSLVAVPGTGPSYATLLAAADSIRVTADSVSMVSDAIWTGKPVAIVPVTQSLLGRAMFGLMDVVRPGERFYPKDLRFFWKALKGIGISEKLAMPRTSTDEVRQAVLDRARSVLDSAVSAASGGSSSPASVPYSRQDSP